MKPLPACPWRRCCRRMLGRRHQVGLVLVAALYVLTLLALARMQRHTLMAFQQLHRFSTHIFARDQHFRQPITGRIRMAHVNVNFIRYVLRNTIQFLQEHSLQDAGEPWVKAVGTLALRQVRSPDPQTSIYRQHCNWTVQDVTDRSFAGSVAPPAWRHSWHVGLPPMKGDWCTVPDGGYYLGLRLQDLASHEQCQGTPAAEVAECVHKLLNSVEMELAHSMWLDSLTSAVTISLTMFDFRHGLASFVALVAERHTTVSWVVVARVAVAYPRSYLLTLLTLVVVLLITGLDLLGSQHRLVKRLLLVAVDAALFFTVSARLAMHFKAAGLLAAATEKFLDEISGQPNTTANTPFGSYEGLEPLARVEQRITAMEMAWMLGLLVKLLSLEWYVTRGFTSFILILRRALRKSYSLVFTLILIVVVHAAAFYRFFGDHLREFEYFGDSLSAMVGYTVGTFNHNAFFLKRFTWKVLFLVSAFTLFLLGSQYILTLFLAAAEAMNEIEESEEAEREKSEDSREEGDPEDEAFLRIVKEELEGTLTNIARGSVPTNTGA